MKDDELKLETAQRRVAELRRQLRLIDDERSKRTEQLNALMSSRSWRITAPLRGLRAWLESYVGTRRPRERHAMIARESTRGASTTRAPAGDGEDRRQSVSADARWRSSPAGELAATATVLRPATVREGSSATTRADDRFAALGGLEGVELARVGASARYLGDLDALQRIALAERSLAARDLIARVASGGKYDFEGLKLLMADESGPNSNALGDACRHLPAALCLARVTANIDSDRQSKELALQLFRNALQGVSGCDRQYYDQILFFELLSEIGDRKEALLQLEASGLRDSSRLDWLCLKANVLHPSRGGEAVDAWISAINETFVACGLEPIELEVSDLPYLDRIVCHAPASAHPDQPLVTVLMTTFGVGHEVDRAISSVLGQTWRHLELIIVDDCSADEDYQKLLRWRDRDARIRIIRTQRNSGTYAAKSLGLKHATGEFVTCHDSDDWSHPRKIETQALQLIAEPGVIGNISMIARVSEELWFRRFTSKGALVYRNSSSLMFRREPVLSAIGCWDEVRTGADTEYIERIELLFGKVTVIQDALLSLGRVHSRSLTSGTVGRGYLSYERRAYESAWRYWHKQISRGRANPTLDLDAGDRPFPAPDPIASDRGAFEKTRQQYDVVLVADFTIERHVDELIASIQRHVDSGQKVAVCQIRALRENELGKRFIRPPVQALVNSGLVSQVDISYDVYCSEVIVLMPSCLEHSAYLQSNIRAKKIGINAAAGSNTPLYGVLEKEACRLFRDAPTAEGPK